MPVWNFLMVGFSMSSELMAMMYWPFALLMAVFVVVLMSVVVSLYRELWEFFCHLL